MHSLSMGQCRSHLRDGTPANGAWFPKPNFYKFTNQSLLAAVRS